MKQQTLGFIGGGNMAQALIAGLIHDGANPSAIRVAEPAEQKRAFIASSFGVHTSDDNRLVASQSDILVLAIKPQVMRQVALDISASIAQHQPLCLSIAAGIKLSSLQQWLGPDIPLVRAMPNTPAMLQAGATGLYAPPEVEAKLRDSAERIMRAVGITTWVKDESQMDMVTAVSGSGPAYFFLFMEAMERAAEELGLKPEVAHLLVLQTALGAARMALENRTSLQDLRQTVTSPGGTTERAILSFEEQGLRSIVSQALHSARDRSVELSLLLAKSE